MARRVSPDPDETLVRFLNRALETRGQMSVNELARRVAARDGRSEKSVLRSARRWASATGTQSSLSRANAEALSEVLSADFAAYVATRGSARDLLTEALERLRKLEKRVAALERP